MPPKLTPPRPNASVAGFLLPSAVFLLVILAALGAFMLHVSGSSQQAGVLDIQGARAYQAARVGVERGLYNALREIPTLCNNTVQTLNLSGSLQGFVVNWQCAPTSYSENGITTTLYHITSTASYGQTGSNDYVERQIQVTAQRSTP